MGSFWRPHRSIYDFSHDLWLRCVLSQSYDIQKITPIDMGYFVTFTKIRIHGFWCFSVTIWYISSLNIEVQVKITTKCQNFTLKLDFLLIILIRLELQCKMLILILKCIEQLHLIMSQHIKWTFVVVRKIPKVEEKYNHNVTKSVSTFCLSVPQHPVLNSVITF